MEKIKEVINSLQNFYLGKKVQINNSIMSKNEASNQFDEIDSFTKEKLEDVFGLQQYTKNCNGLSELEIFGCTKNLIDYTHGYSEGVLFSYWSHRDYVFKETYRTLRIGHRRGNLFYKGNRWAKQEAREGFYKLFEKIENNCKENIPVNFFTEKSIISNLKYLKVKTCTDYSMHTHESETICLPYLINYKFSSNLFNQLFRLICELKAYNYSEDKYIEFINHSSFIADFNNFSELFNNALMEANTINEPVIIHFQKELSDFFKIKLSFEDAFRVIVSYQYYDIPYDMHFFLPKKIDENSNLTSCIAVSLHPTKDIGDFKDVLIELAEKLSLITILEEQIWKKTSDYIALEQNWRIQYNESLELFERLARIGENIGYAICHSKKNDDIKPHLISSRAKDFDSFINKIIDRANGRDEDFVVTEQFKEDVINPKNKESYSRILAGLKDLAGIRIICKYNDDVVSINKRILEYFLDENDLKKIGEPKEFKIDFDNIQIEKPLFYRSIHYCFEIGEHRKNLIEFEALDGLKFEIQVRTTLSQGWADVSHDLYYKPKLSYKEKEKFRNKIREKLNIKAIGLQEIDELFVELKNDYQEKILLNK